MLKRVKGNKGFYSLLLWDTALGSAQIGVILSLINLPLALVVTGLNFGANIVGGLVMGPKEALPPLSAEALAAQKALPPVERGKAFIKKAWGYSRSCFKDPDYIVGSSAAGAGINIFYQSILAIKSVLLTHSSLFITAIAPPVGIALCAGLAAIGLFAVFAGNLDKWKGINKFYANAFRDGQTAEPAPKARKGLIQRFAERPRVKKFVDSRATNGIRKTLLVGMSVESGLFTAIASGTVIFHHVSSMITTPATIVPSLIPMALAVKWGSGAAWHFISAGKLVVRDVFRGGKKKLKGDDVKIAAPAPAAQPAPPVAEPALAAMSAQP